jgi:hypothetical protein
MMDSARNLYVTFMLGSAVIELSPTATTSSWIGTVLDPGACAVLLCGEPDFALNLFTPGLTMDSSTGSLYGSSPIGSVDLTDSLYQLAPPAPGMTAWSLSVIYGHGFNNPRFPVGALVLLGGSIFGTTYTGAIGNINGTVSEFLPAGPGAQWTRAIIHQFAGGSDGQEPIGGLIAVNGALYGTTPLGGIEASGTLFMVAPTGQGGAWVYSKLYDFQGGATDGAGSVAPLTAAPNAVNGGTVVLYGTTYDGGPNSDGTVFQATFPTSPPGSGYTAICNVTCFENSLRGVAPPIWVLGPESVVFEGLITQVSGDGAIVEMQARLLPGFDQPPIGLGEPLKIAFDRRTSLKVGQGVYAGAKGPVSALGSTVELLGVWPIESRPSQARQ